MLHPEPDSAAPRTGAGTAPSGLRPLRAVAAAGAGGVPQARIQRLLADILADLASRRRQGGGPVAISLDTVALDASGRAHLLDHPPVGAPPDPSGKMPFDFGPQADIYGVSALAYALITGVSPRSGAAVAPNAPGFTALSVRQLAGYQPEFLEGVDAGLGLHPASHFSGLADFAARLGILLDDAAVAPARTASAAPQAGQAPLDEPALGLGAAPPDDAGSPDLDAAGETLAEPQGSAAAGHAALGPGRAGVPRDAPPPLGRSAEGPLEDRPTHGGPPASPVVSPHTAPQAVARRRQGRAIALFALLLACTLVAGWWWQRPVGPPAALALGPVRASDEAPAIAATPRVPAPQAVAPASGTQAPVPPPSPAHAPSIPPAARAPEIGRRASTPLGPDANHVTPAPAGSSRAAARTVTVALDIRPWGEIVVDGVVQGVSPPMKTLALKPGRYKIEVRNADLPAYRTTLDVQPGGAPVLRHVFE